MNGDIITCLSSIYFMFSLVISKDYPQQDHDDEIVHKIRWEDDIFFHIVEPMELRYYYRIRKARDFGVRFNSTFHRVPLVLADPPEACNPTFVNAYALQNNVALVFRGQCSFLTKTVNIQETGALAVIIADNDLEQLSLDVEMVDDGTGRYAKIPAAFMIGKSGEIIRTKLQQLHSDHALIDIPVNASVMPNVHIYQPPWSLW